MNLKDLIHFQELNFILSVLTKNGDDARFIGGCIRDILLKRNVNDIDIGTALLPSEVEKIFQQHSSVKVIDVGKEYGTLMIVTNSHRYEITTLRKDVHTDGRYAVVEYTNDWYEDAARRDFTINAMSYCPRTNILYDYFRGQEDLKNGLIKFIGDPDQRVQEDYLRTLRLFRFYTYCGKAINAESLQACKKYAPQIRKLSKERKMNELRRIISHADYIESLTLMEQHDILRHISEVPQWHQGIELCKKLEKICTRYNCRPTLILKIFVLFYRDASANNNIAREFIVLLREEKKYLTKLSKFICSLNSDNSTDIPVEKKFIKALDKIVTKPYYFYYYHSDILQDALLYLSIRQPEFEIDIHHFQKLRNLINKELPMFPITGFDIMSHFSLVSGHKLGIMLDTAKEFWIESKFCADKETLLETLQEKYNQ